MQRLAVYGWTDSTSALLDALCEHAGFKVVAIGDERPAALARARAATGLAGFQHVREMTRTAAFDALLVGAGDGAGDVVEIAAARGAGLLVLGAQAEPDVLARASVAAHRHDVSLTVIRPWLRAPAHALARAQVGNAPPDQLLIEAAEPRAPMRLLRDLVALTTRVMGARALDVSATLTGESIEGAPLTAHLRLAGGRVALLSARMALTPAFRLLASSTDRTLELRTHDGFITIDESAAGGPARRQASVRASQHQLDALRMEARRVAAGDGAELDARLAPMEAAILGAIERALAGAFAQPVEAGPRPFQVLRGGRRATDAREPGVAPALSLVAP